MFSGAHINVNTNVMQILHKVFGDIWVPLRKWNVVFNNLLLFVERTLKGIKEAVRSVFLLLLQLLTLRIA